MKTDNRPKRNKKYFRWDDALVKALHERYMAGENVADLGAELGVTGKSLLCQFHHKGLGARSKHHWWSSSEVKKIILRLESGVRTSVIAKEYGVTQHALRRAISKYGSGVTAGDFIGKTMDSEYKPESKKIWEMRRNGLSFGAICEALGWENTPVAQKRAAIRLKKYCEVVGMAVPRPRVIKQRDGKVRKVSYLGPGGNGTLRPTH
jgi:transposase-like protein